MQKDDVLALSKVDLVLLIQENGSPEFTLKDLEEDIAQGCPVNSDGTFNLFNYAAWLYKGGR